MLSPLSPSTFVRSRSGHALTYFNSSHVTTPVVQASTSGIPSLMIVSTRSKRIHLHAGFCARLEAKRFHNVCSGSFIVRRFAECMNFLSVRDQDSRREALKPFQKRNR